MLFLLGARKNPAIRAVVGVLLVIAGIFIHAPIVIALGAVLIAWAGVQALHAYRVGRQDKVTSGRMP